jgi:hypothetical protein
VTQAVHFTVAQAESGADTDRWLDGYSSSLLADRGVSAVRRFAMTADVGGLPPIDSTHLVLCTGPDIEAPAPFLSGESADAAPAGIRVASFYGYALEEAVDLARLDHVYLVFTKPPPEISVPDFYEWYATHMRENLTADGFDAAWRFRLERDVVDPDAPSEAVHAAIYEVHGELPALNAALRRAEGDGRVIFPPWFPGMQLACLDCYALSATAANPSA